MTLQRRRRYAQQFLLGFVRIGHKTAIDHIGGTGNLGQGRGDEAPGAGFGGGDMQPTRTAQIEHPPCGAAQTLVDHAALHGSRIVAVAIATMPSPRPVKPSFSLVVALTRDAPYRNSSDRGNARAHGVAMRRDARRLANDRHVEMGDDAAPRAHALAGESQKAVRGRSLPLRIGRRKVHPDVAIGERAENGVDQRMQRDVGVRMSGDAARMRNADAAEHDVIAVSKGMHIEAVAGAHVGRGRRAAEFRRGRNRRWSSLSRCRLRLRTR